MKTDLFEQTPRGFVLRPTLCDDAMVGISLGKRKDDPSDSLRCQSTPSDGRSEPVTDLNLVRAVQVRAECADLVGVLPQICSPKAVSAVTLTHKKPLRICKRERRGQEVHPVESRRFVRHGLDGFCIDQSERTRLEAIGFRDGQARQGTDHHGLDGRP